MDMPERPTELTGLLNRMLKGDKEAGDKAMEAMYPLLRKAAGQKMRGERPGHMLEPDALVNEAVIRLFGSKAVTVNNRRHFFALMCLIMKRILIDAGRRSDPLNVAIEESLAQLDARDVVEVVALERALEQARRLEPLGYRVLELRVGHGLTAKETADALGVSVPTVNRRMGDVRVWLYKELRPFLKGEASPPARPRG